jgi:ribosomal protein S18 acetylase RimI-like enzyme
MNINKLSYKSINDASALKDLYDLISEASGTLARSANETDLNYFETVLKKSFENGINIGVYDKEKLVAFIYAYKFEPKVFNHVLANMTIGLHPNYQGKGIGSKLLETFIDQVRKNMEINRIELFTPAINLSAIKLYQRHGFKQEGVFKCRVMLKENPVDDIAMAWLRD